MIIKYFAHNKYKKLRVRWLFKHIFSRLDFSPVDYDAFQTPPGFTFEAR